MIGNIKWNENQCLSMFVIENDRHQFNGCMYNKYVLLPSMRMSNKIDKISPSRIETIENK